MEKRKFKQAVSTVLLLAVVVLLIVLPFLMEAADDTEVFKPSILQTTVSAGSIAETLSAGGPITEQEAISVTVPQGVELTEYLVREGDYVPVGTPLARVSRTSVMKTIASVQETLDHIASEMQDVRFHTTNDILTSAAPARVKILYAKPGDSVREVMLRDGCLAVLSLDGYLAVSITSENVRAGEHLDVILSNGTHVDGRVESATRDGITVLVSDNGPQVGDFVSVCRSDGTVLGTGELFIHSEWRCTAYTGTIASVYAHEEELVWPGSWIYSLKDNEDNSSFTVLSQERAEYEDMMLRLFVMYQDGTINAECNGLVTELDDSLLQLSSSGSVSPMLLSNAPGEDPDAAYLNRAGIVLANGEDGSVAVLMQSYDTVVDDYLDLSAVNLDPDTFTFAQTFPAPPVYSWDGARWVPGQAPVPGGIYLFAYSQEPVWMIPLYIPDYSFDLTDPELWEQLLPDLSEIIGSLDINKIIASMMPSFSFGFSTTPAFERFPLEEAPVLRLIPQDKVTIPVPIDELDILSVSLGQSALVTLDALPGQTFAGVVREIDLTGSNLGGNSKYTVTVELDKTELMLPGMNASILIVISEHNEIPVLPVEALQEENGRTFVYTAYEEAQELLQKPVEITTGCSDGLTVEILSGLSIGDTVWYSYLDTLPISDVLGAA